MSKITRTFSRDELDDLDVPFEHMVEEHVIDTTRRWDVTHQGVFAHPDGSHWQIRWQIPATEHQESDTWFGNDTITGVAVELREVTVQQWLPIDGEARNVAEPPAPLYEIAFTRIGRYGGRSGSPAPVPLTTAARTADELAANVHRYALRYLGSRDVEVNVDLEAMTGWITVGFGSAGEFTITAIEEPTQ
ncbi:hypothetical protein [Embleya sp. NPDC005971]|uniref:hypothetical protein n=1 Tax=Embleya sp. NPDC005971 TaxID=3156724 RepID=UPI0033CE0CAB